METMMAQVMTGIGKIEAQRRPMPALAADQVLVKIKCVGVCGSDVHYFHDGRIGNCAVTPPFILGHECAGEVAAVGGAVTRFKPGDRVALEPGVPCGQCAFCRSGKYNLCPDVTFFATPPYDGTLCEYVAHPQSMTYALPDNMDYEEGALLEPLAVGFHAALQGGARVGMSAAILGSGCIGLVTLLALRAMGVTNVFMTDVLDIRLQMARKLGATALNAKQTDVVDAIRRATGGAGVDLVLEAAGNAASTLQTASLVKRGGTVVLVGMAADGVMNYDVGQLMGKEAEIKTVFRYRNIYPLAIDAVASGRAPVKQVVSHRYAFADTQRAFEESVSRKSEVVKGVIVL